MLSINPRIRIGIVLISAFLISGVVMKYTQDSGTVAPQIHVENLMSDFTQSLSDSKTRIMTSLQSIHLPSLISFSPPNSSNQTSENPQQEISPGSPSPQEWETLPTSPIEKPTSTPAVLAPTNTVPTSSIPHYPTIPPQVPTAKPQPTAIPKPTKPPKPTAIPQEPPVTSDTRPGSTIEEILRDVSKRACIPYGLLMATRTIESGAWLNGNIAQYNVYGWWKDAGQGVCAGLAYYTQSGLIPPDSGGGSCTNGVQPGAYDQKIMGIMQVSEQEEQVTRKNTIKILSKNIDRRVLFDNAVIYAMATKGRAGKSPQTSCSDWPEETIKLVAEKHYGACKYATGNYCNEVWEMYKKFNK